MPVVDWDPKDIEHSNIVQVDSSASDHVQAMHEIEDWAAERGFVRTGEYWLRRIHRADGTTVFRGFCYRLTAEERQSAEEDSRRIDEAIARQRGQ